MKKVLLIFLVFAALNVVAEESPYKKFDGIYFIWGDFVKDKPPEKLDGISVFFDGKAAKRMYDLIKSKAHYNECYDDGTFTKFKGNFECSLSPKGTYSCNFGVDLNDQKVYRAETC